MAQYLPVGLLIAVVLLLQLGFVFGGWQVSDTAIGLRQAVTPPSDQVQNTAALGDLLYDKYVFSVRGGRADPAGGDDRGDRADAAQAASIKRQDVLVQMYRDPETAITMLDIKPGQGL